MTQRAGRASAVALSTKYSAAPVRKCATRTEVSNRSCISMPSDVRSCGKNAPPIVNAKPGRMFPRPGCAAGGSTDMKRTLRCPLIRPEGIPRRATHDPIVLQTLTGLECLHGLFSDLAEIAVGQYLEARLDQLVLKIVTSWPVSPRRNSGCASSGCGAASPVSQIFLAIFKYLMRSSSPFLPPLINLVTRTTSS